MGLPCGTFNTSPEKDMAIVRTGTQWILLGLGVLVFFLLGFVASEDWLVWLIMLGFYAVAVLGLHVLTGLAGQFSMGHAAFMAIGGYTAAILGGRFGVPAWVTLPLAGLFGGMVGLLFGLPALRIKGFYLVMSTIAAQFIVIWALRDSGLKEWTGGHSGIDVPHLVMFGQRIGYVGFWWLTLALVVVAIFLTKNIQRTSAGRRFIAVRDNDLAAEVMGINLFRTKMLAFFIGCSLAGVAGWMLAYFFGRIQVDVFSFQMSLEFLGMIIIGGMGSTTGAIFGVTALRLVDKVTTDYLNPAISDWFPGLAVNVGHSMTLIIFAAVVMFFLMVEPRGLYHRFRRIVLYYRLHPFAY